MQRKYRIKDVDMLVASSTILESAIKNKDVLQQKRSTWRDSFFEDLKTRIDTAIQIYLGYDTAKELRQATMAINGIKKDALKNLMEFKVQVMEDFKEEELRREEIIKQLGFNDNLEKSRRGDQEALITLLYQFKVNIPPLQADIVAKGTSPELITAITDYADKMKAANVGQEFTKGTKKEITEEALNEFNDIYNSIISIAKIATTFFKESGALKDQFNFSKVSKAMNIPKPPRNDSGETPSS
jgi:hypothetical protein